MDDVDAAEVLALVIGVDPYGYGKPVERELDNLIDVWALMLADVDASLAKRAVVAWYRGTGKRISIADVIAGARDAAAQDRADERHRELAARAEADRLALPPAAETRDRRLDLQQLLAEHRTWPAEGHLGMRRAQARWHPHLHEKYREALVETAHSRAARPPSSTEPDETPSPGSPGPPKPSQGN